MTGSVLRTSVERLVTQTIIARPWIVLTLVGLMASTPAAAAWPAWLESWLFNPAERTERAIESFERGDAGAAVEPLETALRLAPGDPRVLYNAGAGLLGAGEAGAEALLEAAAEVGAGELAPLARYNLGNARMAGKDFSGAIEAYQQALRHAPSFEDAKYNLELARRRLEEQEQEQDEQQQDEQQQDPEQQDQQQQNPQQQEQQRQDGPRQDGESEPQPSRQDQEPQPDRQRESPLPDFRDLPDMSAEEAAAILEAVENLEREQRRREASEAARQHRPGEKDW